MALPTLPAITPSMGTGLKEKARLIKVKLVDGYEQVATDGLNAIEVTYEARWQNRTLSELDTLVAFFRARQGVQVFLFTVPGRPPLDAGDARSGMALSGSLQALAVYKLSLWKM